MQYTDMSVWLYRVGRNLNRAYRTCEAFGVRELCLLDCRDATLFGNLFQAFGRVGVQRASDWPDPAGTCALETWGEIPIYDIPWQQTRRLLLGGETDGLPRHMPAQFTAYIPMVGRVSGLTVEAALAIALYEWRRHTE